MKSIGPNLPFFKTEEDVSSYNFIFSWKVHLLATLPVITKYLRFFLKLKIELILFSPKTHYCQIYLMDFISTLKYRQTFYLCSMRDYNLRTEIFVFMKGEFCQKVLGPIFYGLIYGITDRHMNLIRILPICGLILFTPGKKFCENLASSQLTSCVPGRPGAQDRTWNDQQLHLKKSSIVVHCSASSSLRACCCMVAYSYLPVCISCPCPTIIHGTYLPTYLPMSINPEIMIPKILLTTNMFVDHQFATDVQYCYPNIRLRVRTHTHYDLGNFQNRLQCTRTRG